MLHKTLSEIVSLEDSKFIRRLKRFLIIVSRIFHASKKKKIKIKN